MKVRAEDRCKSPSEIPESYFKQTCKDHTHTAKGLKTREHQRDFDLSNILKLSTDCVSKTIYTNL